MKRKRHGFSIRSLVYILFLFPTLLSWLTGCATTRLTDAARNGDRALVRTLLDKGAEVNAREQDGMTPLHWATLNNHADIVRMLLNSGANVKETDRYGFTALHNAMSRGHSDLVGILLDKGAEVNAREQNGMTPLHYAALYNHADIVRILLDKGARVDERDKWDETALHLASYWAYADIVALLLSRGANPAVENKYGKTALIIAEEKGNDTIASMLRKAQEERLAGEKKPAPLAPAAVSTTEEPAPPSPPVPSHAISQHWAVVIGVSEYHDSRIPSLRYAASDAYSFYTWLTSPDGGRYPPSRVKLMVNEQASGQAIREALFIWLKQAIEEDMVVVFFAGHGSPESPDSLENLFLLPYDAHYESIATTGFPMWDIETALKRFIKANKVVVIADACHAGGVGEAFDIARRAGRGMKMNPISTGLQSLSKAGAGVCAISASDEKQFSQEGKQWGGGHGVFTHFLIRGLKGEADYTHDKRVTLGELIPYLSEQVRRATRNAQCPTVAGKFDPALSIGR
jgi:hypothetical protein